MTEAHQVAALYVCPLCKTGSKAQGYEQASYKTMGGGFIAALSCRGCRIKWTSHGATEKEAVQKLLHGGDDGEIRVIKVGTRIKWHRRLWNKNKEEYIEAFHKEGRLVDYIRPGEDAFKVLAKHRNAKSWQVKFARISRNRRMLIEVDRRGAGGQKLKSAFYAPVAGRIEKDRRYEDGAETVDGEPRG